MHILSDSHLPNYKSTIQLPPKDFYSLRNTFNKSKQAQNYLS